MMAAKGAKNHGYTHGMCSGFTEYRYGSKKKPVTLPRVFQGEKRKHVINDVMDILQDWRSSPFEYEGYARHSLRSGLCLEGSSWAAADDEAQSLLSAAFQAIGAPRPTWDQGQRTYSDNGVRCGWCGGDLEGSPGRYCSKLCASMVMVTRSEEENFLHTAAWHAAYKAIRREEAPSKICLQCGTAYKPSTPWKVQKFCSAACSNKASTKYAARPCDNCGVSFRPRRADNVYCSPQCHKERMFRERTFAKICGCCGISFSAKAANASFCSISCRNKLQYERTTRRTRIRPHRAPFVPMHMLTAEVFDGWFRRAA